MSVKNQVTLMVISSNPFQKNFNKKNIELHPKFQPFNPFKISNFKKSKKY